MRIHVVLRYVGIIILLNACFLLAACIISYFNNDTGLLPLGYTMLIAILFGIFPFIFVPRAEEISNREGFTIVILSWLASCMVGFLPYVLYGGEFTIVNAWFESVSGYTTTGSSILNNIENLPKSLLFWRSATHWIGGVGIIIFALSVLPSMGKVGKVLYKKELSAIAAENFRYRTKKVLLIIMSVYVGLTVLETGALFFCGMNLFDAVNHSFATIATGGFSTKNSSIASYRSLPIEIVIMAFMFLSGINFGILFLAVQGKIRALFTSSVVRYYVLGLLVAIVLTTVFLHQNNYSSWEDSFRYASFQILSIGTSTGFATADSSIWPFFVQILLVFFTLQCACSGSTSGGIKTDRFVILWKEFLRRIRILEHPHAVAKIKIDDMVLEDDAVEYSVFYVIFYIAIVSFAALLLSAFNIDIITAFSASAATMGNVGPGLGAVGSMSNFSQIPDLAKYLLTANMLLGRLEIFGVIMFFYYRSWE